MIINEYIIEGWFQDEVSVAKAAEKGADETVVTKISRLQQEKIRWQTSIREYLSSSADFINWHSLWARSVFC